MYAFKVSSNREYMRQYMKDRYHRRRREAAEFLGGRCVDCGVTENLEFDHIDPKTKLFTLSKGWNRPEKEFWAEVRKCVLRCRPCHSERSWERASVPHGGGASGRRNCSCAACRQRKREYMHEYMKSYERKGR